MIHPVQTKALRRRTLMQGGGGGGGGNNGSSSSGSGSSTISSSSNNSGSGGKKSGRRDEGGVATRKGPWIAEEDEILMEYVRKHGPRDWSSIRSKGLLPRTGKSCRLRWVNKLKPDLKTGCKFTPEEERIVIDLQSQFGNKWARIATYLPGRTDNDVKNFWSTRQKRLARILRTPLPGKSSKAQGKALLPSSSSSSSSSSLQGATNSKGASMDLILLGDHNSSNVQCSLVVPCAGDLQVDAMDIMTQIPDMLSSSYLQSLDAALLALEEEEEEEPPVTMQPEDCMLHSHPAPQLPFDQMPQPLRSLPLIPEGSDFLPDLGDIYFPDEFVCQDVPSAPYMQLPEEEGRLPLMGLEVEQQRGITGPEEQQPEIILDDIFDDFPSDMFDYLELPPPQPPPPTTSW